jgi:PAS domain S-box-containing protein
MQQKQRMVAQILGLLRLKPRGLTITEISRTSGINRHSVAKYLDLLLISGRVEVEAIGNAKVYRITQRVPLSAFMGFSKDFILVADGEQRIVQANDNYLKFAGVQRDDLIGYTLEETCLPLISTNPLRSALIKAGNKEIDIPDIVCECGEKMLHFRAKTVPTVFEDGEKGTTVIIEDITDQKEAEAVKGLYARNMEFLAKAAMRFVNAPPANDIYELIGKGVKELVPAGTVVVRSIDLKSGQLCARAVFGEAQKQMVDEIPGKDANGSPVTAIELAGEDRARTATHHTSRRGQPALRSTRGTSCQQTPEGTTGDTALGKGETYTADLSWDGKLYGSVDIFLPENASLGNEDVIKQFLRQASIALRRKIAEDERIQSEARYRELIETINEGIWMIDAWWTTVFVNSQMAGLLGYAPEEMIGREVQAFTNPAQKGRIMDHLLHQKKGDRERFVIEFVRKDGTQISTLVSASPIRDADGLYQGSLATVMGMANWQPVRDAR